MDALILILIVIAFGLNGWQLYKIKAPILLKKAAELVELKNAGVTAAIPPEPDTEFDPYAHLLDDDQWDNLGEELLGPDDSDQGATDVAFHLLDLREQLAQATNPEDKVLLAEEIDDQTRFLIELVLLPITPPPAKYLQQPDFVAEDDELSESLAALNHRSSKA